VYNAVIFLVLYPAKVGNFCQIIVIKKCSFLNFSSIFVFSKLLIMAKNKKINVQGVAITYLILNPSNSRGLENERSFTS